LDQSSDEPSQQPAAQAEGLVGARILQEYFGRAGTLEGALQYYNGAASGPSARYARDARES